MYCKYNGYLDMSYVAESKVIGNIHDDPESDRKDKENDNYKENDT